VVQWAGSAEALRAHLFTHLDGLVVLPTLAALQHRGVHVHLQDQGEVDVDELAGRFEGNAGYLNVALRLLASQGWLEQRATDGRVRYRAHPEALPLLGAARCFSTVPRLLDELIAMPAVLADAPRAQRLADLHAALREAVAARPLPAPMQARLLRMVEGLLAGPVLVHLAMHGARHKMDHRGRDRLANIAAPQRPGADVLLQYLVWCAALEIDAPVLLPEAAFFSTRASAYGVTVSYLHTMARLDELYFGAGDVLWTGAPGSPEIHVDRRPTGAGAAWPARCSSWTASCYGFLRSTSRWWNVSPASPGWKGT
jgi:hypothetical protein